MNTMKIMLRNIPNKIDQVGAINEIIRSGYL